MLIGTAIIAVLSGYMLGIASSLGFLPIPFASKSAASPRGIAHYDDEEESEEEEIEDGSTLDHAPNWANGFEADRRDGLRAGNVDAKAAQEKEKRRLLEESEEECKLVLVVRTDLAMTKGCVFPYSHCSRPR